MSKTAPSDHIQWFRTAAPYINMHRGHTFVVQFGGEMLNSPMFTAFVHDLVLLDALGIRLVLVVGARPQIDARIRARGGEPRYVQGRRVTDAETLIAVKEAVGLVRLEVEAQLSMGLANSPMAGAQIRVSSGNFIMARPIGVRDGIDFCFSGEVRRVDTAALEDALRADQIVALSPIGYSPTGEVFNVSTEEVAMAVAEALNASKLILIGDAASTDLEAQGTPTDDVPLHALARQLTLSEALVLLTQRGGGAESESRESTRQLSAAVHACRNGVTRAHILDRSLDGALLHELFTRDGVGTMVSADAYDVTRSATIDDVAGILELIEPLEAAGILVRRSRDKLEQEIGHFTVMDRDGAIVACAALYPYEGADSMELACLAVDPRYRNGERGESLLLEMERRARRAGARAIFVLTTRTVQWFKEHGFEEAALGSLPMARQALYNFQRNSRVLIKTV